MNKLLINENKLITDESGKILTFSENGVEINGLIEEYKVFAGENINAGDFINFVNSVYKELNGEDESCYQVPKCVLLEEDKVFIAHSYSKYDYLYGTIVEINGLEMTATTTKLNSTSYSCRGCSCVLLEPNKVFIAHNYSSSTYLYGTIVEIDGTTMTATTTQLNTTQYSCDKEPSCCLIDTNKVFIAHCYSRDYYLCGTIVEINGTTMTATTSEIDTTYRACYYHSSCVLIDTNKIFIAYQNSGFYCLKGAVVEINGTTMTSTVKDLDSYNYSCYYIPSCVLLEPNKVFIAHSYGTSDHYLYGTIVTIDGTTMTDTTKQINTSKNSCNTGANCKLLDTNKVLIAHRYSSYLYFTTLEIDGTNMTTISVKNTNKNCYTQPSLILLKKDKAFIATQYDSTTKRLNGTIYLFDDYAVSTTSTIKGIAKTSGTGGETIQVYVPNKE